MTRDTHATASSRHTGRRPTPRTDLGRPSLFADFDQESVEDVEPQRIRLLSTLESQRRVRGRPRAQRLPTGRAHPWLTRALMVVMGLGMLVMLLSFIQLLRRPPPTLPVPQSMAATQALAQPAAAPVEAAKIIDMSPPAGGDPQHPVPAAPEHAAMREVNAAAAETAKQSAPASATVVPAGEHASAGRTTKPASPRASAKRDTSASHDDVALVEAMLAHAAPRKVAPQPTVALQQCGAGNSPEAAVCRARVCVQHPSLPACHEP